MIKIGKLWGDAVFSSLSPNSKLLYIYLCSQPTISTLGVLRISSSKIISDLSSTFPKGTSIRELSQDNKFLIEIEESDDYYTLLIPNHFKSLAKSKATIRKAIDEGKESSGKLKEELYKIFTKDDFSTGDKFKVPTPKEVSDYALSNGYIVNGITFCNYYGDNDWYNKNNKKVRNWKATCDRVWCREENKLVSVKGAPKGYEYFYVETESGEKIFPESWDDGTPSHSNFLYAEMLNNEFTF